MMLHEGPPFHVRINGAIVWFNREVDMLRSLLWWTALSVIGSSAFIVGPLMAADPVGSVDIKEWEVPYASSRPRDPYVVSGQEVWFVGQRGHYLARLDPATGDFIKRDLGDGAGPHNLIVGSDGIVWYAGNRKGYIGRYDPRTDEIEKIVMPDSGARDPHTLIFDADEQRIWFTLQGSNYVGRLTVADRSVDLIPVSTPSGNPYGIDIAPDGVAWVALLGTNKLAAIDPLTLRLHEYEVPDANARPRRIGVTSDGNVYYVDYARGMLGRYDPSGKTFDEWQMPSGSSARPYGMAIDARDNVWFVETGPSPNNFVGFHPPTETFFSLTAIPSGAGSVRHMNYHRPSETVWFGTDRNTIGRAIVGGE